MELRKQQEGPTPDANPEQGQNGSTGRANAPHHLNRHLHNQEPTLNTIIAQHHERDYKAPDGRVMFHVLIDIHHDGSSVQVTGHPTLNRQFTCKLQRNTYLTLLRDEAAKGSPVWLIEAMAGALTSAAAIVDNAEQDLVDRINADLDVRRADREADAAQLAAVVADALGPDRTAHTTWRDRTRKQVVSQANANLGTYAQGAPNRRARTAPLSDVMRRALTLTNPAGEIHVQPGVARPTLRALELSRLGHTVPSAPGRFDIVKLVLNERGLRIAADVKAEAR